MDSKKLSMMAECENCGRNFSLLSCSDVLYHKKEYQVKGSTIYLTYYDCPGCGRRHFVQIDDRHTLSVLKDNQHRFAKLAAKRVNDKDIPKNQSDRYKKKTRYLRRCRIKLMQEFTGVMIYDDETGKDYVLRFSI